MNQKQKEYYDIASNLDNDELINALILLQIEKENLDKDSKKIKEQNKRLKKKNKRLKEENEKLKDEKEKKKKCDKFLECLKCNTLYCQECEEGDIMEILPLDENIDCQIKFICNDCIISTYDIEEEDYKIKEDDIYLCQCCEEAKYSQIMNFELIDNDKKISGKEALLKSNYCLEKK